MKTFELQICKEVFLFQLCSIYLYVTSLLNNKLIGHFCKFLRPFGILIILNNSNQSILESNVINSLFESSHFLVYLLFQPNSYNFKKHCP